MSKNNRPERIDPVGLISEHYEEIKMSDACRLDIQNRTRAVVAARRRRPSLQWIARLAVAAVVIAAIAMCLRPAQIQHPKPGNGHSQMAAGEPHGRRNALSNQSGAKHSKALHEPVSSKIERTAMQSKGVPAPKLRAKGWNTKAHTACAPKLGQPIVVVTFARQPVENSSGKALRVGDRVCSGDIVRTGRTGQVTLVTRKGSELVLGPNGSLIVPSNGVARIDSGRMYCSNREKEIARIDTPAGHVRLLGTVVDTTVLRKDTVAVTVVEGKVQLSNRHGSSLVDAGKRSMLVASRRPQVGRAVDIYRETAWYHGRGDYQSDFGDIAYVRRGKDHVTTEIWTMKADGSCKHRVRSLLGQPAPQTEQWLPGERWLGVSLDSLPWSTTPSKLPRNVSDSYRPIMPDRMLLLNAATGQTTPVDVPDSYFALYRTFSPDAALMAFTGDYHSDAKDRSVYQSGLWVLDTRTGVIKCALSGGIRSGAAWAPDSRHIAISNGAFYTLDHHLFVVDALTGDRRDLGVDGAGASFSPDGTKIAYSGEFSGRRESYYMGVPDTGGIFVMDLAKGGKPIRVSPEDGGALMPRWSPDGSRLLFVAADENCVYVVRADGSNLKKVYEFDRSWLESNPSWTPSGDAIYLWTQDLETGPRILLVAANGSGVIRTLAQIDKDSVLRPDAVAQSNAAADAIHEAAAAFGQGKVHSFEGDLVGARQSYAKSADIFSSLVWDYPLSGLGVDDTLAYADEARKQAERPDGVVLHDGCQERMNDLGFALRLAIAKHKSFPPDVATLLDWASAESWQIGWLRGNDREHVAMLGGCPGAVGHAGDSYVYAPPAVGTEPNIGDVLIRCPLHPDVCYKWDRAGVFALNQEIAESDRAGECGDLIPGLPYKFEHIGDASMSIVEHVMSGKFEVDGRFKLLPLGKVYSNESFTLALDEGGAARAIDAAGVVDWGDLPKDQLRHANDELEFCRCVAKFEAGESVETMPFLRPRGIYTSVDGEPARQMYGGSPRGSCGAFGTTLRFELIGPGNIRLYQLKPSGRFRVYGTVRVQQTGETCKNGWIDKDGRVISTEK